MVNNCEKPQNILDNNEILKKLKIEQKETGNSLSNIVLKSIDWKIIEPLPIRNYPLNPDKTMEKYNKKELTSQEVKIKLDEYEQNQESLNEQFKNLWYKWIDASFEIPSWWYRHVRTLTDIATTTSNKIKYLSQHDYNFYSDRVDYLWKFWNNSIFLIFWEIINELWEIYECPLILALNDNWQASLVALHSTNNIWYDTHFNLYKYNGTLLYIWSKIWAFPTDKEIFTQENDMSVLIHTDGNLSEKFKNLNTTLIPNKSIEIEEQIKQKINSALKS